MTAATEIQRYGSSSFNPAAQRPAVSQSTAIEQQRAIAEVQAAVVVAQGNPRDIASAEAEMEYVCGRLDMAEQAFYQVSNRGTGPSVHLARELARIWGNLDYGVKELHRDDEQGVSEVLAFSWDIQKNSRSSRTFVNPHARIVGKGTAKRRETLIDLTDIYLSNQNVGARAVRECILSILPRWFVEKAQEICRRTLENGEGEPLKDRIAAMVEWFQKMSISVEQLEARAEKKRGAWEAHDVAQFKIAGKSIMAGEANKDELFPPIETSTASEIAAAPASAPDPAPPADEKPKTQRAPRAKAQAAREEIEQQVVDAAVAADQAEGNSTTISPDHRKALDTMSALFINAQLDADDRLTVAASITKKPVDSIDALTEAQALVVAQKLSLWKREGKLDDELREILNAAVLAADNQDGNA